MADLDGSESLEIEAPIERCFEIAADVERAPEWQGTMKSAHALERDGAGRPSLVETELDASVARLHVCLRFSYEEPGRIRWSRERGDLKALEGSWHFEEVGDGRTRASYSLEIGLNRTLSLLRKGIRGPAEDRVRHLLLGRPIEGLKERAEARAGG
jgi:ribosome-associated toxin RatA of RatAB toxin-antitoxin module